MLRYAGVASAALHRIFCRLDASECHECHKLDGSARNDAVSNFFSDEAAPSGGTGFRVQNTDISTCMQRDGETARPHVYLHADPNCAHRRQRLGPQSVPRPRSSEGLLLSCCPSRERLSSFPGHSCTGPPHAPLHATICHGRARRPRRRAYARRLELLPGVLAPLLDFLGVLPLELLLLRCTTRRPARVER